MLRKSLARLLFSGQSSRNRFADKLNATPKIVFSKKLDRAPWGKWDEAKVVKNSAAHEVAKLKQQVGKDAIMWGSISVAQALGGRPLFHDKIDKFEMKLLEAKTFDRGAVLLKYSSVRR